jgi:hypothetical protein
VIDTLEVRFGIVPASVETGLAAITDAARLRELHRLAVICPDAAVFAAGLAAGS